MTGRYKPIGWEDDTYKFMYSDIQFQNEPVLIQAISSTHVNLTRKSTLDKKVRTLLVPVNSAELIKFYEIYHRSDRPSIQRIFPDLDPDMREFVLSGTPGNIYDNFFYDKPHGVA